MSIFWKAGVPGSNHVPVHCEKCGSDFFYELARVGTGRAYAPEFAERRAREDLARRLAREAELVPCPRCRWINEELIARYRHARYQGWATFAGGLAMIGIAISLLVGLFLFQWNARDPDQSSAWVVLIGGPIVSLVLAGLVLLVRNWLRSGIKPNQNYPEPPIRLPRGSPPPLVKNPWTGDFEAAPPKPDKGEPVHKGDDFSSVRKRPAIGPWIELQAGRARFPLACMICLSPPNPQYADRRKVLKVKLELPLCVVCARRRNRLVRTIVLISLGATMVVVVPLLIALGARKLDNTVFWVWVVILASFVPLIALVVAQTLTNQVRVRVIDRQRGVIRLRFRNQDYRKLIEQSAR